MAMSELGAIEECGSMEDGHSQNGLESLFPNEKFSCGTIKNQKIGSSNGGWDMWLDTSRRLLIKSMNLHKTDTD